MSPCRFTVFFWGGVYCITTVTPFIRRTKSWLVTSIWQGHGPVATKMPLFCRNSSLLQTFSAPTQEGNLLFLSKRSAQKKLYNFPIILNHLCRLRGTSGFRPVPVTAVALACVAGGIVWVLCGYCWRYCVGARLKFRRRSRVPKKGSRSISRGFAARDGSADKSHSTTTQYRQLRRLLLRLPTNLHYDN